MHPHRRLENIRRILDASGGSRAEECNPNLCFSVDATTSLTTTCERAPGCGRLEHFGPMNDDSTANLHQTPNQLIHQQHTRLEENPQGLGGTEPNVRRDKTAARVARELTSMLAELSLQPRTCWNFLSRSSISFVLRQGTGLANDTCIVVLKLVERGRPEDLSIKHGATRSRQRREQQKRRRSEEVEEMKRKRSNKSRQRTTRRERKKKKKKKKI